MAMNYKCKNIKIRLAAGTMACALGLAAMPGIMNVRAADISQTGDETAVAILAEAMADNAGCKPSAVFGQCEERMPAG